MSLDDHGMTLVQRAAETFREEDRGQRHLSWSQLIGIGDSTDLRITLEALIEAGRMRGVTVQFREATDGIAVRWFPRRTP